VIRSALLIRNGEREERKFSPRTVELGKRGKFFIK